MIEIEMTEFLKVPVFDNFDNVSGSVGTYFLTGEKVSNQRHKKKPGQTVTLYKIIDKTPNSVVYMPVYLKLK